MKTIASPFSFPVEVGVASYPVRWHPACLLVRWRRWAAGLSNRAVVLLLVSPNAVVARLATPDSALVVEKLPRTFES